MKNDTKQIDYKKLRDEAIAAKVEFRKMGNNEMAEAYLNLAAHIVKIRTEIDPVNIPKDSSLI